MANTTKDVNPPICRWLSEGVGSPSPLAFLVQLNGQSCIQRTAHRLNVRMDVLHRGAYVRVVQYVLRDMDVPFGAIHETRSQKVTKTVGRHLVPCELRQRLKESLHLPCVHRRSLMAMTKPVHIKELILSFEPRVMGCDNQLAHVRIQPIRYWHYTLRMRFRAYCGRTENTFFQIYVTSLYVQQLVQSYARVKECFHQALPEPGRVYF